MSDYKDKIIKSNQEAATSAWINYLNDLRIERLSFDLSTQRRNFTNAISDIDKMYELAKNAVGDNGKGPRGSAKGVHGFIAEIYEVGLDNAERKFAGKSASTIWVDNNGPADLTRNGIGIQMKFCEKNMSLNAIEKHLEKYPDWVKNGNSYQIPKDHYEKIMYYRSISSKEANLMPRNTDNFNKSEWQKVHDFFEKGDVPINRIKPSHLQYNEVQANVYQTTKEIKEKEFAQQERTVEKAIEDQYAPSFMEGIRVAGISGAIEGGAGLVTSIIAIKRNTGKKITDFSDDDWKHVVSNTGQGLIKGTARGGALYALQFTGIMNSFVANGLVTAAFSLGELIYKKQRYNMQNDEFISKCEDVVVSSAVSVVSSLLGNTFIPIPVLGAVIGNTIGNLLLQLSGQNKEMLQYTRELRKEKEQLNKQLNCFLDQLIIRENKFITLLDAAFVPDYSLAFQNSVKLAREMGVEEEKILKTIDDIDNYFN